MTQFTISGSALEHIEQIQSALRADPQNAQVVNPGWNEQDITTEVVNPGWGEQDISDLQIRPRQTA